MENAGDTLRLEGMRFFGHHGDVPAERELGSHLEVDVEVQGDLATAGHSDRLADTVDYLRCIEVVRTVVERHQYHLLEAVAEAIAQGLLREQKARRVRVTVAKRPPVDAAIDRFSVSIERSRA